jgi:hypothetical protein
VTTTRLADWLRPKAAEWLERHGQAPFLIVDFARDKPEPSPQKAVPSSVAPTDVYTKIEIFEDIRPDSRVFRLVKGEDKPYPGRILLGRAPSNDICLELLTVSRLQLSFEQHERGWVVTDLGSTNGTLVAGAPLGNQQTRRLEEGCELRIGPEVRARFYSRTAFKMLMRELKRAHDPRR